MHVLYSLCIFVSVIYYMFKTEISVHIIRQMQLRVCYVCIVHMHPFRPAMNDEWEKGNYFHPVVHTMKQTCPL